MPKDKAEKKSKVKKEYVKKIDKMRIGAAEGKQSDITSVLSSVSDDIDSTDADSKQAAALGELTALHLAALNGHRACVEVLLKAGASIERQAPSGSTPLNLAAAAGHSKVVKYLVSKGALIEAKDREGQTPLIVAARNGEADCVATLLALGAKLENKDRGGDTALLMAARGQKLGCVGFLIGAGANVQHRNAMKKTVLDIADSAAMRALVSTGPLRKQLTLHFFGAENAVTCAETLNVVCEYAFEPPRSDSADDDGNEGSGDEAVDGKSES